MRFFIISSVLISNLWIQEVESACITSIGSPGCWIEGECKEKIKLVKLWCDAGHTDRDCVLHDLNEATCDTFRKLIGKSKDAPTSTSSPEDQTQSATTLTSSGNLLVNDLNLNTLESATTGNQISSTTTDLATTNDLSTEQATTEVSTSSSTTEDGAVEIDAFTSGIDVNTIVSSSADEKEHAEESPARKSTTKAPSDSTEPISAVDGTTSVPAQLVTNVDIIVLRNSSDSVMSAEESTTANVLLIITNASSSSQDHSAMESASASILNTYNVSRISNEIVHGSDNVSSENYTIGSADNLFVQYNQSSEALSTNLSQQVNGSSIVEFLPRSVNGSLPDIEMQDPEMTINKTMTVNDTNTSNIQPEASAVSNTAMPALANGSNITEELVAYELANLTYSGKTEVQINETAASNQTTANNESIVHGEEPQMSNALTAFPLTNVSANAEILVVGSNDSVNAHATLVESNQTMNGLSKASTANAMVIGNINVLSSEEVDIASSTVSIANVTSSVNNTTADIVKLD